MYILTNVKIKSNILNQSKIYELPASQ